MPDTTQMRHLDALRDRLPDAAKDLRLNLQAVLRSEHLTGEQVWGVALASAYFVRCDPLRDALLADAQAEGVGEAVLDDARAAAALMGMNTVYYRFRHMVGREAYGRRPPRLRMSRMASPASSKADIELFSLACAALAGCETCIRAHEASLRKHGLTEAHAHDAARIAAVVHGVAIALST